MIIVEGKHGYLLDENLSSGWRLRRLKNVRDVSLTMVWHRFGNTVAIEGALKQWDREKQLFAMTTDGSKEQWCRLKRSGRQEMPALGSRIKVFGWRKWHSQIIEVLELDDRCTSPLMSGREPSVPV